MKQSLCLLLVLVTGFAHAHEPSRSLLTLAVDGAAVSGQWDIALRDLEDAVGLDSNADSVVAWGEVRARSAEILAYALPRLAVAGSDGSACALDGRLAGIESHGGAAFAALALEGVCAVPPTALRVDYGLLFDLDGAHRGIVTLAGEGVAAAVLSAGTRQVTLAVAGHGAWATVRRFTAEGVWHIWQGYDHLAFVMLLLLPIALGAARGGAARTWRAVAYDVARIVTAFTLAHSLTLALAAFGVVAVPTRAVELVIAASVLLAAAWNLVPGAPRLGAKLAFAFGLVHGFGFANALGDLTAGGGAALVYALGGFNVGVELGQLAVVAVLLPLLWLIRGAAVWPRVVNGAVSATCAIVAVGWVVERWA